MLRDSLKWGLAGCVVLYIMTTILAFTGWRYRMPSDDNILFLMRTGSLAASIAIAIWLLLTGKRSSTG